MAVPAPAIPTGNTYTVNVARPAAATSALPPFAVAAALLLRRWKIPVRMHVAGADPAQNALRLRLNEGGARPSAFSPAPSPEVPGEGFWKTTATVVEATTHGAPNPFWAGERADKKVDWDPLLIALSNGALTQELPESVVRQPDLWIVSPSSEAQHHGATADVARRWVDAGAGAVCVVGRDEIAWHTVGAVFGNAVGARNRVAPQPPENPSSAHDTLGVFAAGVVAGLLRDLLSENLFDKTLVRADRECLGMRPLRLGRAVIEGLAALEAAEAIQVAAATGSVDPFKGFPERTEARRVALLGPEARPWAHKGR